MATLAQHELAEALDTLIAADRDESVFTFDYVPYPRLGCGAGPPVADVVVTNTATGVSHTYPAGPRSDWLARFEAHVTGGHYWPA